MGFSRTSITNSPQQELTEPVSPSNNTIVQANLSTVGDEATMGPFQTSGSIQTLPEQTPVKMLSRLRFLGEFNWSTSSTGVLWFEDLEELLRTNAELAPLLSQYRLYRSNFRLFVRINSNQFYAGALMISNWPQEKTMGTYRHQRAVLSPMTMSASTQQSVDFEIGYPYDKEWISSIDPASVGQTQPLYVAIEVLAPLEATSDTLTDTIKVQVFGAYVDPVLQFNCDPGDLPVAQSKVEIISKGGKKEIKTSLAASPARDANTRKDGLNPSFKETAPTLSSIPIVGTVFGSLYDLLKIGVNTVTGLAPTVSSLAPLAPLLLDKPESAKDTLRAYGTVGTDLFASDVATTAVPVTYSKDNYARMLTGMGVRLGTWSVAQYAAIPGLALATTLSQIAPAGNLPITLSPTPFGRTVSLFSYWKGSLRYTIQAFASAFTSARVAIYLRPTGSSSTNYDDHIVKIIDVKGDTTVSFTVPFVNNLAWYQGDPPFTVSYRLISPIVGSDAALDPTVFLAVWLSAGPDAQFALERPPATWNMPTTAPLPETAPSPEPVASSKVRRLAKGDSVITKVPAEPQSAIQTHFLNDEFPPIVEGCSYTIDNGYAISDTPVTYNDLLKRFRPFSYANTDAKSFYQSTNVTDYPHSAFLNNFGAMRGGYMVKGRLRDDNEPDHVARVWPITTVLNNTPNASLSCSVTNDGWHSLAFPWVYARPFYFRRTPLPGFSRVQLQAPAWWGTPTYAFRDDIELGLPVLPPTGQ